MPTSSRGPSPAARDHGDDQHDRVLRVRVTGFSRRFAAAAIDAILLAGISVVVTAATALALGAPLPRAKEIGPDLLVAGILDRNPMAVGAIGLFLGLTLLYELYCTGMAGQTLGMRLVRIRVIGSRGRPPGAIRGLVRVLAYGVSVVPGGLGWLWALFDREHRALHDHLAGTYVILDNAP
jgi:uncharacterized RDD family membrane protein YckC